MHANVYNEKLTCTPVEADEEIYDERQQRALNQRPWDLGHAHRRSPSCRREKFGVSLLVEHPASK